MSRPPDKPDSRDARATDATLTGEFGIGSAVPGDIIGGRYRLDRLVGMGAMGQVFEAHDLHLDTPVAAKLLRADLAHDPLALERFRQELLTARKISHPNIIRLHDMIREGDQWLITMDYVDGESLHDRIQREGRLAVDDAVAICRQLAAGLSGAHRVGVVHRDLKPANILLDRNGNALISDFGIARSISHAGLTREGTLLGTPDYLSPEQAAGETVDARSDLYALGIILCEMLTGRLPFKATTTQEAISQRLARSPTPLDTERDQIPAWLQRICHRLLRREVDRRYQSAEQVLRDLDARGASGNNALPLIATASVLLAGLLIAATVFWLWPQRETADGSPPTADAGRTGIAVLPALGLETAEESWAAAAYLSAMLDDMQAAADIRPGRVRWVASRLQLEPDRIPDHLPALSQALEQPWLVVPELSTERAIARLFPPTGTEPQVQLSTDTADDRRMQIRALAVQIRQAMDQSRELPEPGLPGTWPALREFHTGLALLQQGDTLQAVPVLEQASRLAPASPAAFWALSRAYDLQGRGNDAQDAAMKAAANADTDGYYHLLARSRQAAAVGDHEQAETLLEQLAQRYPDNATVKLLQAESAGDGGDLERALDLLAQATALAPEHARSWFLRAKYSILSGNSRRAVDDYLVEAEKIYTSLGNRQGQADVINAKGVAYERLGQLDAAAEQYRRAARLREALGDRRGQAATLRNLAAIAAIQGDNAMAQQHVDEARVLLEQLSDLDGLSDLYNDVGFVAEERGDYQAALEAYRRSLEFRRRLPDERDLAESLSNVGYAYYQLGEFDNALAYWRQAAQTFEKTGDAYGLIHTLQQLALLDWVGGRWSEAVERLNQSIHQAESLQMHEELAVTRAQLAEVRFTQGQLAEALALATASGAAFHHRQDQRGVVEMTLLQARALLSMGAVDEAAQLLAEISLAGANAEQQAKGQMLHARLRAAQGEQPAAREAIQSAATQAQISGSPVLALEVDVTALELGLAQGSSWEALVDRAAELEHLPLLLRTTAAAIHHALRAGDESAAAAWLEGRWSQVASVGRYRQRYRYTAAGIALCPIAGADCEAWNQRHDAAVNQLVAAAPEPRQAALRSFLADREAPQL